MRWKFLSAAATICGFTSIAGAVPITLTATVRDFRANGVEFEGIKWSPPSPSAYFANDQNNKLEKGIVGPLGTPLGADGDPVYFSARDPGFYNTVPREWLFNEWWDDSADSMHIDVPLEFADLGNGLHKYANYSFFPIDTRGFGNETFGHNFHFTMQFGGIFQYVPGQSILAESDDDLWIYIDDKLVLDMGGTHGAWGGSIQLDDLNLRPGEFYPFDVFHTDRNTTSSVFVLTTDILSALPEPTAAMMLPILAGMGLRRRRRN